MAHETVFRIGLAAGIVKSFAHFPTGLVDFASHITFGSFTLEPKVGNPEPTYWFDEETHSSINAVGLTNQGLKDFLDKDITAIARALKKSATYLSVSIAPLKPGDVAEMCKVINEHPYGNLIKVLEINAACPNHRDEGGSHPVLAHDTASLRGLMEEAQEYKDFKRIKIAPRSKEVVLRCVVDYCMELGFFSIVSANTRSESSFIKGKQRLSVETGGRAGRTLLEDGVAQVRNLKKLVGSARRPMIVACGGVMDAEGYQAYLEAGAFEVQLATGFIQFGSKIFRDIGVSYFETYGPN